MVSRKDQYSLKAMTIEDIESSQKEARAALEVSIAKFQCHKVHSCARLLVHDYSLTLTFM